MVEQHWPVEVAAAGIGNLDGITLTHGGPRARVGDLEKGVVLSLNYQQRDGEDVMVEALVGRRNDNGF